MGQGLNHMLYIIKGIKNLDYLNQLLAAVVARFVQIEDRTLTVERLRTMIQTLESE